MESFNKQINTYLNFYNKTNKYKKGYEIDGNIVLTNCYSIVVFPFSANKKQMQRLNEMNIELVKENDKKNTINDDFIIKQLKNFIEGFKNQNFCESINIENITSDLKITDDFSFSRKQIKNIQRLINGKGIFTSKENNQVISLTGKNGYAWLLACRTF